ncbi:accessory gene regulator B family protein [Paenibacillus sp. OV219]|uniref:accessory gene regulator B family protein n=1 Tax=Paenibacillus sp. OV219 TaxID=1884377 RepID=UPI0008BB77FD|nr:accessory gene regulator B family protein [Paenibacillus sp. OV219]SEO18593.1 accessory gene regulator B [Paenibacillus sp. OV219]
MLQRAAAALHARIKESGAEAPSVPVIVYALEIVFNTVSIALLVLLVGLATGELLRTAELLILFAVVRFISGGYHLPSNSYCIIVSTIVLATLPHINLPDAFMFGLTCASLLMMIIFAPANYDTYARIAPKYYPLMKLLACLIVAANLLLQSDMLALAFAVQAVLLPFKNKPASAA